MGLNILFSIAFARIFEAVGWMPLGGLALANSLATALEATALFILMRNRLDGIEGGFIAKGLGASALAALGMTVGLWIWFQFSADLSSWIITIGGVVIGSGIYLAGLRVLRVPELQYITSAVLRRLKRS
jgi:putative peptidoglycan lipid II flippase